MYYPAIKIRVPFLPLMVTLLFVGCHSGSRDQRKTDADSARLSARNNWSKPPSSFEDSLVIHAGSAVFFHPDSLQLQKIQAVTKKEVFSSVEHDCFYQMKNARLVLQKYWPEIHQIEISRIRFLLFTGQEGLKKKVDLNAVGDICGIYLFNGVKDPIRIDMTNVDTELGFYFSRNK